MAGSFETKRVMSLPEYRVFQQVEVEVTALNKGYRVFAQTSLGEVLASKDDRAFRAINSKRVATKGAPRIGPPLRVAARKRVCGVAPLGKG